AEAKSAASKAVQSLETCAVSVPPGGASSFRVGKLYGDSGNLERQAAWYQRALSEFDTEQNPPTAYVHRAASALAGYQISSSGWQAAQPELERMRKTSPNDPDVLVMLLIVNLHRGNIPAAEGLLTELKPLAGARSDELSYLKGIVRT